MAQGTIIKNQCTPDLIVIGEHDKNEGNKIEGIYKKMCSNNPQSIK